MVIRCLSLSFPMKRFGEKKWIHAIRRDIGEHFEIRDTTKVCDFVKTLGGRRGLRSDAVPSVFQWTCTSPRKRKPPTQRETVRETSRVIFQEPEPQEEPNYWENIVDGECVTRCENAQSDAETQTEVIQKAEEDIETSLRQELADLKSELEKAHQRIEALQNQLFSVERFQNNNNAINFYTGFASWDVGMAVFNYLNPGDKGENIN